MKITFVLPTLSLTGGIPVVSIFAERLRKRGHSVFVISTPAGAAPEILSGGTGILVRPEDPEEMAKAIERICQMPNSKWQALSEAACAKVNNYTWEDATAYFEAA